MGTDHKNKKSFLVGISQINTTLGNFILNRQRILSDVQRASRDGCKLVVFPETTLFGYHPFDMLERPALVEAQLAEMFYIQKSLPAGIGVILGVIAKNPKKSGRPYFNSAVLLEKGKKPKYFHKQLLPTGDVFDEARFIERGSIKNNFVRFQGKTILVTICEDIWAWPMKNRRNQYGENPLLSVAKKKVDLVVNLSASPFYPGKKKVRHQLVSNTAKLFKAPMVYCNLVGGQDEIIYDGASFACDDKGREVLACSYFQEDFKIFELENHRNVEKNKPVPNIVLLKQALVLGIRDYCGKTGIENVHLGLSGGVDSALVACLAVEALGAEHVKAFALPTTYNSPESLELAQELAKNLGISVQNISIQNIFETMKSLVDQELDIHRFSLVHENLQARIRGCILMAVANHENSLLLSTSNKSEYATGYATLYGDMCGGLAPIGDLLKRQVYELCDLYNSDRELIPSLIMTRDPSAELRPHQKDKDSLPSYVDLDQAVENLVENCSPAKTKTEKWLNPLLLRTEFKRWQAPPILKVSRHGFGRGRRYPIAQQAREI
ncbi:MAG: NAD+ synthase [Bdellovibrio sp. CG10_big_fil_rev_8_21_14_0_10_47_8]|nr:MAG: NAD+ synthase [Bdellovibrio sp. CG10_big_fil_rev_8_21_14_0_10_47_8]